MAWQEQGSQATFWEFVSKRMHGEERRPGKRAFSDNFGFSPSRPSAARLSPEVTAPDRKCTKCDNHDERPVEHVRASILHTPSQPTLFRTPGERHRIFTALCMVVFYWGHHSVASLIIFWSEDDPEKFLFSRKK